MEEKSKTFSIEIEGVVQGVGFRPFIYNLAKELNLTGFVRNTKKGLQIEITGPEAKLNSFIERIKTNPPRLSIIKNLVYSEKDSKYLNYFEIIESVEGKESNIFLSPDISVCSDCEKDFFDIESPYYKYPFVNCTNCGPRFSIILDYPYDRKNTSMKKFPMCPSCEKEYYDISSRRYHAQPISCHKCGPQFKLYDKFLNEIITENIFEELTTLISNGNIIAVKGVGGYHLILSATDKNAVQRLRELKKRDRKPFALLFKDINLVRKFAYLSDYEEEVLKGKERPILLLKKKKGLIEGDFDPISGHSPYYGVMLPYTPFHFLILEKNPILICTSANISGEPIVYREEDLKRIENIADYFLIHNRDIERFVEDSVVKIIETPFLEGKYQKIFFRKSRGYAP
ncbi:MAG: Sua5/YciO/YrdC/YwlC family protein, partial [Proteobacteria bacterium]|nr:Sua5/YciO/YrdC/YwlC family protein [Pseudomonadota bacterium]